MSKTHYKKLQHPDYLGAYAVDQGQEPVLTIKEVKNETVTGADGKKEECIVCHFANANVKPMILNSTNCKTIAKVYKSPYIEDWQGKQIQLYVAQIKAFGDDVEALRIRPAVPKQSKIQFTDKVFESAVSKILAGETTIEAVCAAVELTTEQENRITDEVLLRKEGIGYA